MSAGNIVLTGTKVSAINTVSASNKESAGNIVLAPKLELGYG